MPEGARHPIHGVIAGAITGAIEMAINFPTDYVKTQLQLDEKSSNRRYTGPIDVIRKTIRSHGIRGMYRGLNVAIFNPKVAVRFGAFEQLKRIFQDENGKLSHHALLFCGIGAGMMEGALAVTPIESIKVKFIHDQNSKTPQYRGLIHGVRLIIAEKGFRGLYQGVVPTIIKSGTNQGTRFFAFGFFKNVYSELYPGQKITAPVIAVFGGIAGMISVFVTSPADVVKSRMQGLNAHKYSGTIDCFRKIWTKEGPAALYKGTVPRLVRVPIEVSIVFSVYEIITDLMSKYL